MISTSEFTSYHHLNVRNDRAFILGTVISNHLLPWFSRPFLSPLQPQESLRTSASHTGHLYTRAPNLTSPERCKILFFLDSKHVGQR